MAMIPDVLKFTTAFEKSMFALRTARVSRNDNAQRDPLLA